MGKLLFISRSPLGLRELKLGWSIGKTDANSDGRSPLGLRELKQILLHALRHPRSRSSLGLRELKHIANNCRTSKNKVAARLGCVN